MHTEVPRIHIDSFRHGDKKTFRNIFDAMYGSLCLFTNRFLNDLPAAEDIVQETFVSLWDHRSDMESEIHIRSFLYQVARNKALNYLKRETIRSRHSELIIKELETETQFLHFAIAEEVERIMLETEARLAPQCRKIFGMAMKGLTNEEIAAQLNISVNTVKTQKKIAYRIVKEYISQNGRFSIELLVMSVIALK